MAQITGPTGETGGLGPIGPIGPTGPTQPQPILPPFADMDWELKMFDYLVKFKTAGLINPQEFVAYAKKLNDKVHESLDKVLDGING